MSGLHSFHTSSEGTFHLDFTSKKKIKIGFSVNIMSMNNTASKKPLGELCDNWLSKVQLLLPRLIKNLKLNPPMYIKKKGQLLSNASKCEALSAVLIT